MNAMGEEFILANETFSVELILEPRCGEIIENVFRIEKMNYSSEMNSTSINYTSTCNNKTSNIKKDIKKYTSSKTGSCTFLKSNNYNITFQEKNKTVSWNISVTCEEEIELLEEEKVEEELVEPVCFDSFDVAVNQEVFHEDEQVTMDFFVDKNPDFLEITYWIETLNKSFIKNKRTTTNLDTKKYTFKKVEKEQGAYIVGIAQDNCSKKETRKLIVIEGKEENEVEEEEPELHIEKIEQLNNQAITVNIQAKRGNSKSSTIHVYVENMEEKVLFEEKIKLEHIKSAATITTILLTEVEEGKVVVEGMNLYDEETFLIEKIPTAQLISTHTKQKYYDKNLTWYVRTKQEKPILVEVQSNIDSASKIITTRGEKTTVFELAYDGGPINTSLFFENTIESKIDTPNSIHKEIQKKENTQEEKEENHTKNKSLITANTIAENYHLSKEKNIEIFTPKMKRNALYGLFGSILAASTYLLLKEQ